jgi:hypothetical protein
MDTLYLVANGPAPTTAAQATVTTGTAIKTMLQLATASTQSLYIAEWGISFDGSAAATPIKCELFGCTGAATVTAYAAADVVKLTSPNDESAVVQLGTALSGYTASAEGTVANARMFDAQLVAPTGQYVKQFPLGREPRAAVSTFVRIRVTAAAAVNCYCYVVFGQ